MTLRLVPALGVSILLLFGVLSPSRAQVKIENEKQWEAEKLLREAERLTNIRTPGDPAFLLMAQVKVFGEKGQATEGTYSLVWKGPTDWQDKLRIGDFSQERTAVLNRLFVSRGTNSFTMEVEQLLGLLEFPSLLHFSPEVGSQKLRIKSKNGSQEREIEVGLPGYLAGETIFLSASSAIPTRVESKNSRYGSRFEDYAEFNGHPFPRLLSEFDSHKPRVQAQVLELRTATSEETAFSPLADAHWHLWCPNPKPMRLLDSGEGILMPPWIGIMDRVVDIYGVVGTDGGWHDLTVVKSGGKEVDGFFMDVMRKQRFTPASCGETPVLSELVMRFGMN